MYLRVWMKKRVNSFFRRQQWIIYKKLSWLGKHPIDLLKFQFVNMLREIRSSFNALDRDNSAVQSSRMVFSLLLGELYR